MGNALLRIAGAIWIIFWLYLLLVGQPNDPALVTPAVIFLAAFGIILAMPFPPSKP